MQKIVEKEERKKEETKNTNIKNGKAKEILSIAFISPSIV